MHKHIFIAQLKIGNVNVFIWLIIVSIFYCLQIAMYGNIFGRFFPIRNYRIWCGARICSKQKNQSANIELTLDLFGIVHRIRSRNAWQIRRKKIRVTCQILIADGHLSAKIKTHNMRVMFSIFHYIGSYLCTWDNMNHLFWIHIWLKCDIWSLITILSNCIVRTAWIIRTI